MKRLILLLAIALSFASGCGSTSNNSTDDSTTPTLPLIGIGCIELINEGSQNACTNPVLAQSVFSSAYSATTIIDAGVISRGVLIESTVTVNNSTGADWVGYYSITFDAGCNGALTWEIVPIQQTQVVVAGGNWTATTGGSCGDMALGNRVMAAVLYDSDQITILDTVEVQFLLVE